MSERYAIVEARVNARNRGVVADFVRLDGVRAERKLKPAESKRYARLKTQLLRTNVLVPMTNQILEEHARVMYRALPRWKKLFMRLRYALHVVRARLDVLRLRLRS